MNEIILGIKIANSEDLSYQRCLNFLEERGYKIYKDTLLFYIEDKYKGHIKAVAGWHVDLGSMIEPLVSDVSVYTKTLGLFMAGFIIGKGYGHITCKTNNNEWKNILIELGFNVINDNTTLLAKGI